MAALLAASVTAQPGTPGFTRWPHLSQVRIVRQQGRWEGLPRPDPIDPFGQAGSGTMFVISGYVRNVGPQPIAFVKFAFELLDQDGIVVYREYGYNYRAEELRGATYENGWITRGELHIDPILPGETDMFRMLFLRDEIPPFQSWRVRVLEVGYDSEWTGPARPAIGGTA